MQQKYGTSVSTAPVQPEVGNYRESASDSTLSHHVNMRDTAHERMQASLSICEHSLQFKSFAQFCSVASDVGHVGQGRQHTCGLLNGSLISQRCLVLSSVNVDAKQPSCLSV